MKIKTSELTGAALDWAVEKADKVDDIRVPRPKRINYHPSTDWAQGGPIIEREQIATRRPSWNHPKEAWVAEIYGCTEQGYGPTPLIAAMRCFVASKLGDGVEVPQELL